MTKKINKIRKETRDNFIGYIKTIYEIIRKPEMAILPGQLAFFILLSLVPIITLLGFGAGIFNINMDTVIALLDDAIPGGIDLLIPYMTGESIDLMLAIVFIWMFYLASNGFNSVILISNQIYGINQSNWFKRRIKAIFMTLITVVLLLCLLVLPIYGSKLLYLFDFLDISDKIIKSLTTFRLPIIWLVMFVFIRTIYEIAPDRVRKNSHINAGAMFTSIGWIIVTYIYSSISQNLTTYNIFYGALSNIAALMMWLYFMAFIFVIGLTLNYGKEQDMENLDRTGAVKVVKNR